MAKSKQLITIARLILMKWVWYWTEQLFGDV